MKIYERYIVVQVLRSFLLVLFVLSGLFSIILLLDEVSDVGTGRYMWPDALLFVVRSIPHRVLDIIPLTGLLGTILALGRLGATNELVVLRAVGVSAWRIALTVQKAGVVILLGAFVVAQFVAPRIQRDADEKRSFAIHDPAAIHLDAGFWFRDGTRFVQVARVLPGRRLADVAIYDFDCEGRLRERTRAREAQVLDSQSWILDDVRQDVLHGATFEIEREESLPWRSSFDRSFIDLTSLKPESLSISELVVYVSSMREWGQVNEAYRLQLWRLFGLPLSTLAMLLLAIPFALALGRSSSGLRLALGGLLGTLGYALDRIGGHLGLLSGASPALTALLPGVLILVVAVLLMRRLR